jgi:hypothetical protein
MHWLEEVEQNEWMVNVYWMVPGTGAGNYQTMTKL